MLSLVALASHAQLVGIPGAGGTINPQTGQFYPNAGDAGVVNPQTGQYHPYVDSRSNGAVSRRHQPDLPQGTVVIDGATGQRYIDVGNGYVNQSTGRFVPK